MKTPFLLFFYVFALSADFVSGAADAKKIQIELPADPHAGHQHSTGADCEVAGSPSHQAVELAQQVTLAVQDKELSPEFCEAMQACEKIDGYYSSESQDRCSSARSFLEIARTQVRATGRGTCGMAPEELAALAYYMGHGYGCINRHLWKTPDAVPKASLLVDRVNSALRRLPRYQGLVIRGSKLPENVKAKHTQGATVTYEAFTSTSTNRQTAEDFSEDAMFIIYSHSGRPVMTLSDGENEILFRSNTNFRIVDINERTIEKYDEKVKVSFYVMREVAGQETSKQRSVNDKNVMKLVAANQHQKYSSDDSWDPSKHDRWACPADENAKVPAKIKQGKAPPTRDFGN